MNSSHKFDSDIEIILFDKNEKQSEIILLPKKKKHEDLLIITTEQEKIVLPFRSWVRQYYSMLNILIHKTASTSLPDTRMRLITNSLISTGTTGIVRSAHLEANQSSWGIIAGSSSTAVNYDNYSLGTRIAHSAAGLSYSDTVINPIVTVSGVSEFSIERILMNQSASPITINECGYYANTNDTDDTFCLCRDTLDIDDNPLSIAVPASQGVNIEYSFSLDEDTFLKENFLSIIRGELNAFNTTCTDITGTPREITRNSTRTYLDFLSEIGIENYGIVVGDGTLGPTHALSNQLVDPDIKYHTMQKENIFTEGSNLCFSLKRNFTNISGGSFDLSELGLYVMNNTFSYCLGKKDLDVPITIEDQQSFQIRLIFKI